MSFISCNSSPAANISTAGKIDSLDKRMLSGTGVHAQKIDYKPFIYSIESNGKIKSFKEHTFYALASGMISVCNAKSGSFFSSKAVLLQMETTVSQLKLERSRLNLFNAQKEYESQLLGYDNLLKGKDENEANEIKKKLRISSGLSDAEQDLKESDYELSQSVMVAPFNGVIANVNVKGGDYIKPGQELFTMYGAEDLYAEIKILEDDIFSVKKGTPSQIIPTANEDLSYMGAVYEVNPYVDENGMVQVLVKISKGVNDLWLFPGMNCRVQIKLPLQQALTVPKSAVVLRSGREVVFTLKNNKAKWHYVVLGRDNGREVEVKEGLTAGEKVIVANNLQLGDGSPVHEIQNK